MKKRIVYENEIQYKEGKIEIFMFKILTNEISSRHLVSAYFKTRLKTFLAAVNLN